MIKQARGEISPCASIHLACLQNIIDERIPKSVKKRLIEPLKPRPPRKTAPVKPVRQNLKKQKAILELFDPVPEINSGGMPQYKLDKEVKVGLKEYRAVVPGNIR